VVLSILLVFGGWGFPRMGPVGSGVGTLIARFVMVVTLVGSAWDELRPLMAWRRDTLALAPFWRVIQIGLPIAAGIELEFGVFAVVGLFMGHLGPVPMAAHQVALNISSLTFMVPLGIGSAGSVLVGRAIGAEDPTSARRTAVAALTCGVGFMGVSALVLTFAPRLIAGAYTNDPATLALAASLIPIAGVFQVFDGTQTVSIGLLRGAGDTRTPMIVNLLGYWLIGLPISIWLGARLGMGPQGYWWGLVVGLAFVGIALAARVRVRMGGQLERLHIDHPHTGPAAH
jgi:MATE family multidrug resistance protein